MILIEATNQFSKRTEKVWFVALHRQVLILAAETRPGYFKAWTYVVPADCRCHEEEAKKAYEEAVGLVPLLELWARGFFRGAPFCDWKYDR